jgi:tetratricopeptide (TPR) repeat protein
MALKLASADIEYSDSVKAFDKGDFQSFIDHFFVAIHARYDIEQPLIKRYIRRKLNVVNTLRGEVDSLKEQLAEKDKQLAGKQKLMNTYADEYLKLGRESLKMESPSSAIANFNKAIDINPEFIDAYIELGKTYREIGKFHESLEAINKALELHPASFKGLYQRAKTRFSLGYLEEAAGDADRVTSLKPDNIPAHQLFGDILSKMGQEEDAAIQWAIAERLREKKKKGKK